MLTPINYSTTQSGNLLTDGQMRLQVPRATFQIRFNVIGDDKELILSAYMPVLCLLLYMTLFIRMAFKYTKM